MRSPRRSPDRRRIDGGLRPKAATEIPAARSSIASSAVRRQGHRRSAALDYPRALAARLGPARIAAIALLIVWGSFAALVSASRDAVAAPPIAAPPFARPATTLGTGTLELILQDFDTGKPVAARLAIYDSKNRLKRLPGVVTEGNAFWVFYQVTLKLPEGDYRYDLDAGPEYRPLTGTFSISNNDSSRQVAELERTVDLGSEQWAVIEQGFFAPRDEADVQATAIGADLIAVRSGAVPPRRGRRDFAAPSDPQHVPFTMHALELGEVRLTLWDPAVEPFGDSPTDPAALPTDPRSLADWKRADSRRRILLDSVNARSLPLWVGLELIDGVGLLSSFDAPSPERVPTAAYDIETTEARDPRALLRRSIDTYAQLLATGVTLPPVAASRWTDTDQPLGAHRTMTAVEIEGRQVAPWDALSEGIVWISSGPLVRFDADRKPPGSRFALEGAPLTLDIGLKVSTRGGLEHLEFYRDGQLDRRVTRDDLASGQEQLRFEFSRSGWLLPIAWAKEGDAPRIAVGAPFRVESNEPAPIDVTAIDRMLARLDELQADRGFVRGTGATDTDFGQARDFWNSRRSD